MVKPQVFCDRRDSFLNLLQSVLFFTFTKGEWLIISTFLFLIFIIVLTYCCRKFVGCSPTLKKNSWIIFRTIFIRFKWAFVVDNMWKFNWNPFYLLEIGSSLWFQIHTNELAANFLREVVFAKEYVKKKGISKVCFTYSFPYLNGAYNYVYCLTFKTMCAVQH